MKNKLLISMLRSVVSHGLFKFILIPLFLTFFWILSSTISVPGSSFSVIPSYYNQNNFNNVFYEKLLKGKKISGEIKAKENNLAIIIVRLITPVNVPFDKEDLITFKIKESGSKTWYAQNQYRSGIFKNLSLFPFGFPKIVNSQNKNYDFEISSLKGNNDNAIVLSRDEPSLIAQYKFSKKEILSNPKAFLTFLVKKIVDSFSNFEFFTLSLPYALPLVFYLIWLILESKISRIWLRLNNNLLNIETYILLHTVFVFILFGLLVNYTDLTYPFFIISLFFWIITVIKYRLDSSVTFIYSGIFFIISIIAIILGNIYLLEKASSFLYLFILVASFQMILEERINARGRVNYKNFLKNTFRLK